MIPRREFNTTGSGSSDPADTSDDSDDSGSTTTFRTSSDTLSTTSLGASTSGGSSDPTDDGDDEVSITVVDDADPAASSPAGGAGEDAGVARVTGMDEEEVQDYRASGGDPLDLSQRVSDVWMDRRRQLRDLGLEVDAAESVGSVFQPHEDGILGSQRSAAVSAGLDELGDLPSNAAARARGASTKAIVAIVAIGVTLLAVVGGAVSMED